MQPRGFDCKRIWFGPKSGFLQATKWGIPPPTHSDVRKILWLLGSPCFFESLESYGHGSQHCAMAMAAMTGDLRRLHVVWLSEYLGPGGTANRWMSGDMWTLMFKWAPFYERLWTIGICKANSYWSLYTVETSRNQLGDLADWGITLSLDVDDGYCIGSLINHDQSTMASNQKLSDNPNVKTMKLSRWSRWSRFTIIIIIIIIISYYGPLGLHQNRPWEPLGESKLHHVGRRVFKLVLFSYVSWTKLVQISPL